MIKLLTESIPDLTRAKVLIVDDQPLNREILLGALAGKYQLYSASSGEEAIATAHKVQPDIVLLDVMLGGIDGIEVCKQLKSDELLHDVPVLFITSIESNTDEVTCWEVGAADFLLKPVNTITLNHRIKAQLTLKFQQDFLKKLVYLDGLTGVYNRRFFYEQLHTYRKQQKRDESDLSLLMIDVDHFKSYNDTFGHLAGDECLKQVARTLSKEARRPRDFVARYGGEEFVILLSETDELGAKQVAQSILVAMAGQDGSSDPALNSLSTNDVLPKITVSIGITHCRATDIIDDKEWVKQADQALYQAKRDGRNQCYMFTQMAKTSEGTDHTNSSLSSH